MIKKAYTVTKFIVLNIMIVQESFIKIIKGEIALKDYDWYDKNRYVHPYLEQLRYMLAKAYVPYQWYVMKYPLDKALMVGTLFPELVKPWPPYYYEEVVKK